MRNFDYLKGNDHLMPLYNFCNEAEVNQICDPEKSALNGRKALEWLTRTIYALKNIHIEERTSLYTLMCGEPFTSFINDSQLIRGVHYIRKAGNNAAHIGFVKRKESFFSLLNLYNFVGSVLVKLQVIDTFEPFNKELIPRHAPIRKVEKVSTAPSEEFIGSIKIENIPDSPVQTHKLDISEAETRKLFIDMMLKEAGWDVLETEGAIQGLKACIEVEVEGMPNNAGVGYADYVLFGANGKPLAVIEAKRTSVDISVGRNQAKLYADCLEKKYGVRPVIYCSNGYSTEVVDGLGYPARNVLGFHNAADLALIIQRRGRDRITDLKIDNNITNREYQKRAVRQVCERFNLNQRRSLLVMATGTGKTRVSISIADVLMRNRWAKNILFLADRTALVKQAARNYAKLLPSATTCILNEDDAPDMNARIMFSTYQTMIKKIDSESKDFSIGRFDLIFIDEAHRSVYGKYTAIFDYFDSLIVGLTATPRDEVEKNTFDLFNMDPQDTFAYELQEAVNDKFLVDKKVFNRGSLILREGIRYDNLNPEEKEQMEVIWEYEKAKKALVDDFHRDIESAELFKYIFNINTIDMVLQDLMEKGLKVDGGEKIGKTIIFAFNHAHADLIVKRFAELYPQYGPDFCVLIDNYVKYAQNLIDNFEVRDKLPQIAVSVDMLDTGIDVPDILNLVFFKRVKSKIKFNQMIGRGTRLSENIFGIGRHKELFYIFDWCKNFEYFNQNSKGEESLTVQSISERLFCLRTDIAVELQHARYREEEFTRGLHDELKQILQNQVLQLQDNIISVRQNWGIVDKFRNPEKWQYLSPIDATELKNTIAPLVVKSLGNPYALRFDILILGIMLDLITDNGDISKPLGRVKLIAQQLQSRASIPQVAEKMDTIMGVCAPDFIETITVEKLEKVRLDLRELVQFLIGERNKTFTVNIDDIFEDGGEIELTSTLSYRQKVLDYLAANKDLPVLQKIINLEQLSKNDIVELEHILWKELGTKEDYEKYVARGRMLCGGSVAAFIRAQIGVDRQVALDKFSQFLQGNILNTSQEEYLKSIITYVCENGDITTETIVNEAPFDTFEWKRVFGDNLIKVGQYVRELHNCIVA